jgi:hypothetical protein
VTVDTASSLHVMAGGIGASWHAISKPFVLTHLINNLENRWARGSAWGGNPPIAAEAGWAQLEEHASWLGLDWVRVELSQRMYEPERDVFDWNNEEMEALYRILDWCERSGADVFLTQMWSFVGWNAHEGVPPLQSAPRSVDDFADGLATLLDHLVRKRGYSSIRWLSIANEPNSRWWLGPGGKRQPMIPALRAVRAALDERGLDVGLAAPGFSDLKDGRELIFDHTQPIALAAYDAHSWGRPNAGGLSRWTRRARTAGIAFFLSEMGDMRFGSGDESPGPTTWAANLSTVEKVLVGLNLGVDGFGRWSFTNRGDLDGQFQLVRTWDRESKGYLDEIAPEPVPYYVYGLLTRLSAKHSTVLKIDVVGGDDLVAAAVASPGGNLTLFLLNKSDALSFTDVRFAGSNGELTLARFELTEGSLRSPGYRLEPFGERIVSSGDGATRLELPAASLSALTTFDLEAEGRGVIID